MVELATNVHGNGVGGTGRQRATGQGRRERLLWLQERIQGLPFRLGLRQPADMPLGTRVLVLRGDARNDLGQMAVISAIVGTQVEISYRGPTGHIKTRQKQRASLIWMEEGVELVVNAQGWPIIRTSYEQDETDGDEENGVVTADDDSQTG